MSDLIKNTLSALYKSEISSEQAVKELEENLSADETAEYLVDAFNRGWISPFNVGLDSDGNVVS